MAAPFADILQRAEELRTGVKLKDVSRYYTTESSTNEATKLDIDLADIFSRSEKIWSQKKLTCGKNIPGSSIKSARDGTKLALSLTSLYKPSVSTDSNDTRLNADTVQYLEEEQDEQTNDENELGKYVEESFERARIEMERTFLNQQILDRVRNVNFFKPSSSAKKDSLKMPAFVCPSEPSPELNREQQIFARKIDSLLVRDCTSSIITGLQEIVEKINLPRSREIWDKAFALCHKPPVKSSEDTGELRASKSWRDFVIFTSIGYLQDQFLNHMERTVEANLTKAKRGGIPGVLSLIEAYLNVVHTSRYSFEDCLYPNTNHPIWTVLFYCLRVGDLPAAAEVATKILSATHCSTLVNILLNLPKKSSIDNETRVKLRTEWRQSLNTCKDNYKKAVYAAFLGYDCHEINTNIEDWLWARLFNCKMNQFERTKSFRQLQLTVCVECGEKYFVLDGGSKLLYYSVLLLTGQLEQAINALLHESCLVHAVHLAILFHQLRLLIVNEDVSADTLTTDVHDPTICKLNLAKIVLLYIKNFELTDVNYALNYCFFLNKLNLDSVVGTTGGRNLFESCVSRLVHLTGETDKILGKLNENGERLPGIIDKFSSSVNIYKVIACVASDINLYGKPLQTINLYALANHPNEAIKLMSNQLAATITDPKSNSAKETITLAKWLERRYRSAAGEHLSTLHCLIQLYDVFLLYSNHQYAEVLDAMQSIKLIPMECEEVQAHVNTFHMVPEEVRPVLPELCTLLMDSIASLYSLQSSDSLITSILKDSAKALALYTATIPYKFPLSVNSILLQLQTKIL